MKQVNEIDGLIEQVNALNAVQPFGRITRVDQGAVQVFGLGTDACLGDRVKIRRRSGDDLLGEIVQLDGNKLTALLPLHQRQSADHWVSAWKPRLR